MRWFRFLSVCIALVASAESALGQALDNPVLGQAEVLVREGKADEAWQLLAPLEPRYAGRPDYDFLLAIAALESGRAARATFILERIVAVNPGHMAARLEMGRAYFELNDFERAQREFLLLLKSSPPPDTRAVVQSYLGRMGEGAKGGQDGLSGYVEVIAGRDTNVGAAAAQSSIFIPALNTNFFPDPLFQRRPDDFTGLGAGLEYAKALDGRFSVIAGADYRQRWHADTVQFDSRAVDAYVSLRHRVDEDDRLDFSIHHNDYELDNRRYRRMLSLGAQWSRALSVRSRIGVSAHGYRIRYVAEDTQASSSDLALVAASVTHVLHAASRTIAGAGVHLGYDNAVAGRTDGDRRILGHSLGLQTRVAQRVEAYVRYSLLSSDYRTENEHFFDSRRDRQHDAAIGLDWHLADGWLLRPQVARTKNHSNVPLNEYGRTETSITLRRVWD
jgi:tetratricopeptide (TPR) repeat protein